MFSLALFNFSLYFLGALVLLSAVYSVLASKSTHYAVIYLIGVFTGTAILLIMQNVLFGGISYIIVYVGAILVLFLFVIFLIDTNVKGLESTLSFGNLATSGFIFIGLAYMINMIIPFSPFYAAELFVYQIFLGEEFVPDQTMLPISQVQALALNLYTTHFVLLIVIGFILLLTMLAVIILSKKH